MGEDSEDSDAESGKEPNPPISTGLTVDIDVSGILAAQKVAEEVVQPAAVQSIIETQKTVERAVKPALVRDAIQMQKTMENAIQPALVQDIVQMQKIAESVVNPALVRSITQTQKIAESAIQPAMIQSIVEMQQALDSVLVQLNAPSIAADMSTIAATVHRKRSTPSVGQYKYSATDIDEIRPPESHIHDKLIWDDGEWYRHRTREISYDLVDYIFWKAKQTGELTDASDEEISFGATVATFFITLALTGGNVIASATVAGFTGGATFRGGKAAKRRNERKNLEEKFTNDK